MQYEIIYTNGYESEKVNKTISLMCSKVLIREGAAIFVDTAGTVLKVIPLAKLVSITLEE